MKSIKWAILGAIFFPLVAYIYVYPKGRKGIGALRGIGMTAAAVSGYIVANLIAMGIRVEPADMRSIIGFAFLEGFAVEGFIIWDIYRLVKKYNGLVAKQ